MRPSLSYGAAIMFALATAATSANAAAPGGFKENPRDCRNTGNFSSWITGFKKEAMASGISKRTIARALDGVSLDEGVIRRDRRQGFFAQSFSALQI